MRHERVLHGAGGEQRADQHDRRQQPGVGPCCAPSEPGLRLPGCPSVGNQPDDAHDDSAETGQGKRARPDRPQVGVEHQQAGPVGALTRPRYWAL